MGKPVVHFEIIGKDSSKLGSFYSDLFEWKIDSNNSMNYGMVDTGGQGINGGIAQAMGPDQTGVKIYMQVEDPQSTLDKAEKLGGKTIMPVTEVPDANITMAMFTDPEGNVMGLIKG